MQIVYGPTLCQNCKGNGECTTLEYTSVLIETTTSSCYYGCTHSDRSFSGRCKVCGGASCGWWAMGGCSHNSSWMTGSQVAKPHSCGICEGKGGAPCEHGLMKKHCIHNKAEQHDD